MKKLHRLLFFLHMFVGVGAIAGGLGAILNPQEPMGVSVELLENSPFDNYLIPGIILFAVVGLGNILSAITLRNNFKFQGYMSSIFGWALVIWIVIQCIMINTVHFLHVLYFSIGLIEAALSMTILYKQRLFPTNIVLNIFEKQDKQHSDS